MTPDARELWPPPAVDTIDRGARRRLGRRRRRRDRSDWANAKLCCRGAAPRGIDDEVAETLDDEPLPLERADASVPWENVSLALLRTRWSRSAPERRDAVGSWAAARRAAAGAGCLTGISQRRPQTVLQLACCVRAAVRRDWAACASRAFDAEAAVASDAHPHRAERTTSDATEIPSTSSPDDRDEGEADDLENDEDDAAARGVDHAAAASSPPPCARWPLTIVHVVNPVRWCAPLRPGSAHATVVRERVEVGGGVRRAVAEPPRASVHPTKAHSMLPQVLDDAPRKRTSLLTLQSLARAKRVAEAASSASSASSATGWSSGVGAPTDDAAPPPGQVATSLAVELIIVDYADGGRSALTGGGGDAGGGGETPATRRSPLLSRADLAAFRFAAPLNRSVLDLMATEESASAASPPPSSSPRRRLPVLRDVLDRGLASDAWWPPPPPGRRRRSRPDVAIFSNADIAVFPWFYLAIEVP